MALKIRHTPTLEGESAIRFLEMIENQSKNKISKDKLEIMKNKYYKILENSNIKYGKEN